MRTAAQTRFTPPSSVVVGLARGALRHGGGAGGTELDVSTGRAVLVNEASSGLTGSGAEPEHDERPERRETREW